MPEEVAAGLPGGAPEAEEAEEVEEAGEEEGAMEESKLHEAKCPKCRHEDCGCGCDPETGKGCNCDPVS